MGNGFYEGNPPPHRPVETTISCNIAVKWNVMGYKLAHYKDHLCGQMSGLLVSWMAGQV